MMTVCLRVVAVPGCVLCAVSSCHLCGCSALFLGSPDLWLGFRFCVRVRVSTVLSAVLPRLRESSGGSPRSLFPSVQIKSVGSGDCGLNIAGSSFDSTNRYPDDVFGSIDNSMPALVLLELN